MRQLLTVFVLGPAPASTGRTGNLVPFDTLWNCDQPAETEAWVRPSKVGLGGTGWR